ncbi:MAG: YraN family protein [Chloroflexi bacterium HGW-Chloroflexi-3]|nr:MAG: YraN family protein [Chloroflexi bacterium HGW-Chloroflexi-3]
MNKQELAHWGEETAQYYLSERGIRIVETNFRTQYGEIDIIGFENDDLVFFEVKTRSSIKFGYPEEAVNTKKIEKIEMVANEYLDNLSSNNLNWRIDTIAIIRNPQTQKYQIKWFKNVEA